MDRKYVVVIADEQPVVRWALQAYLASHYDLDVVGEASSRAALEQLAKQCRPDVIVTALSFADGPVVECLSRLPERSQSVAFTHESSWECVQEFTAAGGLGFVPMKAPLAELVSAIRAAAKKQLWIAPSLRSVTVSTDERTETSGPDLTLREREVVALIAKGKTSKQVAEQLCVSRKTVETHRYRIFKKLGIKRIAQLADYAIRSGIVIGLLGICCNASTAFSALLGASC